MYKDRIFLCDKYKLAYLNILALSVRERLVSDPRFRILATCF